MYPEVVADHYIYRGAVDNHNALMHDCGAKAKIGFESALGTTWWIIRFFFFIAYTEVNVYLAMKYLLNMYDNFMNF